MEQNKAIFITQMCKGCKFSLQIYGRHSLREDGTYIPFEEQMAIVSRWMPTEDI